MTAKPRKPLLVNLTCVAVLVFAPVVYVLSLGGFFWLAGRGFISGKALIRLEQLVYSPIVWYCKSEHPGHGALNIYYGWCLHQGNEVESF